MASTEQIFTNATLVLPDETKVGTLVIKDGLIRDINFENTSIPRAEDLNKNYLLPGLVEVHTDNLERHCLPRPGVKWPLTAAVLSHDAELAAAGITTVLDAIAVGGDIRTNEARATMLLDAANAVKEAVGNNILRIDHHLHLRCEVPMPNVLELFEPFKTEKLVRLVSLMDHTPGERQFVNQEKQRIYYQGKYSMSDDEYEEFVENKKHLQIKYSEKHRQEIAKICRENGIIIATHDDATASHVKEGIALGATISEFPTTVDSARAAKKLKMGTVMGGPNIVRGGSHSGNVSASYLAELDLLDALSSDYAPSSLLHSAFILNLKHGIPLPKAISKVTEAPAKMVGLSDRGVLQNGFRADLLEVELTKDRIPIVHRVISKGKRVI